MTLGEKIQWALGLSVVSLGLSACAFLSGIVFLVRQGNRRR